MNIEDKAYKLYKSGSSYGEIADELSISKSTAHNYVKKMKKLNEEVISPLFQHSLTNDLNVRSNQNKNERRTNESLCINKIKMSDVKEFTGDELLKKEFITLEFTGKFLELIGKPSKPFSGIIWGLPKSGKSNFAIRFADYLSEYFGAVCYIAAEEGESVTLQSKVRDIGGSEVTFVEIKDKNEIRSYLQTREFDFVFIDSINNASISHDFLEFLNTDNPLVSFLAIVQATKSGHFKGGQELAHNCDFLIKVVSGIAYHEGRFNNISEMPIFTQSLYKKNPDKKTELTPEIKTKDIHREIDNYASIEELVNIVKKPIELVKAKNIEIAPFENGLSSQIVISAGKQVSKHAFNPKAFLTLLFWGVGLEIVCEIIRQEKANNSLVNQ